MLRESELCIPPPGSLGGHHNHGFHTYFDFLRGLPTVLSIPPGSTVSDESGIHLGRKVVPSARMEALMRHYKAAGFSDEVSRLAAAPRRLSTNRMYSFFDTHGLSPQTVKGYRTCLGLVLNRTGKLKWFRQYDCMHGVTKAQSYACSTTMGFRTCVRSLKQTSI